MKIFLNTLLFSSFFVAIQDEINSESKILTNLSPEIVLNIYIFLVIFLNLISYLYIIIKFFKIVCYTKMTCEWFPMINPYEWPFSFFKTLTQPYFKFWSGILPTLKFQKSSVEISGIIALEALNAAIYLCVRLTNILVLNLEEFETVLTATQ